MTIRLSPVQRAILHAAAARPDGTLTPVPAAVTVRDKSLERTLAALVRRGFAADASTQTDEAAGQSMEDASVTGLVITRTGRAAAGATDGAADVVEAQTPSPDLTALGSHCSVIPAPGGKLGMVLQVVSKVDGASIEEIAGATNWLRHTSRAALTRLRRRGFDIRSEQIDGRRVYRLHPAA